MEKKHNILIVDDNKSFVQTLSASLLLEGYTIFSAYNIIEALTVLKKETVDLILLDFKLPDIDGLEFINGYKEKYQNIPIILMTAYAKEDVEHRALADGARFFLRKPFSRNELLDVVDQTIHSLVQEGVPLRQKKMDVLIVDDDNEFRELVRAILESKGFHVAEATTGQQAIDYVRRDRFDVVLLNVMMPALDGVSTFYELKTIDKAAKIIFITEYLNEGTTKQMLEKGALGVILKQSPFDTKSLLVTLKKVLL